MDQEHLIIAISSISGGGKSTLVYKLVELLGDAIVVEFDDYATDETYPQDPAAILQSMTDFNVFKTPLLAQHLGALRRGEAVPHPQTGALVSPAKYIVFEGPLGRAQAATGQYIDYLVFIDTPLEVGLARRIARGIDPDKIEQLSKDDLVSQLKSIRSYADVYVQWVRKVYQAQYQLVRPYSDLVLDWEASPQEQAQSIIAALKAARLIEPDAPD